MARVLVVEDDDVVRTLLEARLVAADHWVRTAASLAEAEAVLRRIGPPDVLVSDMFMPGGSGLALVAELRRDPERADVPVVLLSGRALPGDVAAAEAMGATYLTKPVETTALLEAVDLAAASSAATLGDAVRRHLGDPARCADRAAARSAAQRLEAFLGTAPDLLTDVLAAIGTGEAEPLAGAADRLGAAAREVGAAPLARWCADLADRSRTGDAAVPDAGAVLAEHEVRRTCRVLAAVAEEFRQAAEAPASPPAPARA